MQRIETGTSGVILAKAEISRSDRIVGWALLEDHPNERLVIRYSTSDGMVIRSVAEVQRPDIAALGFGDGSSGFELVLPRPLPSEVTSVEVWVEGYEVALNAVLERPRDTLAPFFSLRPNQCHEAIGVIDRISGESIEGWLFSPDPSAVPVLRIGERFAEPVELRKPRPDVCAALGVSGDMGFVFKTNHLSPDDIVELHVLTTNGLKFLASQSSGNAKLESNFFAQLNNAARIARLPGAVAVVCWDGAHNPIGRAKVLYDVARSQRPAVLVTYLSESFGGRVWQPLESLDISVVTIPWAQRALYHRALKRAGVQFDTVWICKPRYPSFVLAKAVATPNGCLILDHDDNEEHFSRSAGARDRPFGLSTMNLAKLLSDRIPARTAASKTLQQKFLAKLVRHARVRQSARRDVAVGPYRVAFIGTVRAHKNILKAARAIRLFALTTGYNVEFHVYGDFKPAELGEELINNGAVIVSGVHMSELYQTLGEMDESLTGFPGDTDTEVTDYQISSKIGDALSVGKPVLVPNGPSVADLSGIPGVHLFDAASFGQALKAALNSDQEIHLPDEFSVNGAYKAFAAAEEQAVSSEPASVLLSPLSVEEEADSGTREALLLIWKQPDAGFYGRRVDQVARAYKRANPDRKVIILELVHQTTLDAYERNSQNFASDQGRLLRISYLKQARYLEDEGVELRQIVYSSSARLGSEFDNFLLDNELLPTNTSVVVFPLINFYEKIVSTLASYTLIVDIVDNQFSWPGTDAVRTKMLQYVTFCRSAAAVLFNSKVNEEFFRANGIIAGNVKSLTIPNWYAPPLDVEVTHAPSSSGVNIFYSGNMTDRIDWSLLQKIADSDTQATIHLVGSANVSRPEFAALLQATNVVYHGPLSERQTLELLRRMDVAVMPHQVDEVSTFMNPLKVHMYAYLGVPTVATDVPGIIETTWLRVADDHQQFLSLLRMFATNRPAARLVTDQAATAGEYIHLIDELRQKRGEPQDADTPEIIEFARCGS
jgi:glycosyltransferase involved in cell wall biosynthesis